MEKKKLRIAQVTNCWESVPPKNKGGLEQMVYYLIEGLVKKGHQVTLFGTNDSQISGDIHPIWPYAVSHDPYGQHLPLVTYTTWSVSEAFRHAEKFDIIHNHTSFVAEHFASLISTPLVTTFHHQTESQESFMQKYPEVYRNYFTNIETKHFLNQAYVAVSQNQGKSMNHLTKIIYNGIPENEWSEFSLEKGSYFAFLGYISGNKGVHEAIQAILPTDEKLKIAGAVMDHDLQSVQYFEEKVKPYIDGRQIEYIGPISAEQKIDFLINAKAVLMPIQWEEPFGLVAIEAMACGTPVIAWNRGALPEIIENDISGYLIDSIPQMTNKIKEVDNLNRKNARKRYLERFTAQKMIDSYEALYYDILGS